MTKKDQNQLKLKKALEKIEMDYAICLKELNKSKVEARAKAYVKYGSQELTEKPQALIRFLP